MNKTKSKKSRKSKEKTPPQCGVIMKNSPPVLEAVTTSRGVWVEIQKPQSSTRNQLFSIFM